ncbi:Sfi1 spindle body protein-domain-containing protein [Morchella snyderi]|nr:Sfi1 spindle body protein-domain-containing protein [Morchella snyderi]
MQPSQQGDDIGASHPRYHYSPADLQILHEIISLATVFPGKNSFRAVYRAYDVVLAARKINPAFDSVYFRFILQLQSVPGKDIHERFMELLSRQGIDGHFLETPSAAATAEFTRQRYDTARRRRDRSSHGTTTDVSSDDYRGPRHAARRSFNGLASSPTHEAIVAAELAARTRREEVSARRSRGRARRRSRSLVGTTVVGEDEDQEGLEELGRGEEEEEGEVEEIQRPRVPADAADALYALRMKAELRRFFGHWHAKTVKRVEQRWFAVVEQRAERRYNTLLVAKAWGIWIQKTATIVQRTQEVRQRILVRKYFNAWRAQVIENEEKVRLFQLSNALYKWRAATKKQRQIAQVAQRVYQENLAHRAYWTWFFQLCGILGMRRYNRMVAEQCFDAWAEKTERVIQLNRMASAFRRRHTLQTVFNSWSEKTLHCLDAADIAADHSEWKLTEKVFDAWRRQAQFAPLVAAVTEAVDTRIAREHLSLWRHRTKQSLTAAAHARAALLTTALRTWRLHLRSKIIAERAADALLARTLNTWVLHTRCRQFTAWRDANLARHALTHWAARERTLAQRLEAAGTRVVVAANARLAHEVIGFMKQRLEFRQELEADAAALRAHSLLSTALLRWRLKADLVRMYADWADDAVYYFTARRALRTWKRSFKASRRDRLRAAFHAVSRRNKRSLASAVVSHWAGRAAHQHTLNAAASAFAHGRAADIAGDALTHWRGRTAHIVGQHAVAESHHAVALATGTLALWAARLQHVGALREAAGALRARHDAALADRMLSRWAEGAFRVKLLALSGDRFVRKRLKTVFRAWKNRALERVYDREQQEEEEEEEEQEEEEQRGGGRGGIGGRGGGGGRGVLDDTLDDAFGAQWVLPLPPQQAPVVDLGRSIFGGSVVRGGPPGQGSALGRSVLGRSMLGRSLTSSSRGSTTTPAAAAAVAATPGWKGNRWGRLATPLVVQTPKRGLGGLMMTPRRGAGAGETPGSPLLRFSRSRGGGGFMGMPAMSEEFE